jgi:hypothetical protein
MEMLTKFEMDEGNSVHLELSDHSEDLDRYCDPPFNVHVARSLSFGTAEIHFNDFGRDDFGRDDCNWQIDGGDYAFPYVTLTITAHTNENNGYGPVEHTRLILDLSVENAEELAGILAGMVVAHKAESHRAYMAQLKIENAKVEATAS